MLPRPAVCKQEAREGGGAPWSESRAENRNSVLEVPVRGRSAGRQRKGDVPLPLPFVLLSLPHRRDEPTCTGDPSAPLST